MIVDRTNDGRGSERREVGEIDINAAAQERDRFLS